MSNQSSETNKNIGSETPAHASIGSSSPLSREVDVRSIATGFGHWIRCFFNFILSGLVSFLLFAKKHFLLLLVFAVLGLSGGIAYYYFSRPYYRSTMTIQSNDRFMDNNYLGKIFDDLNNMCKRKSYKGLSDALNISLEQAMYLKSFDLGEKTDIYDMASVYSRHADFLLKIKSERERNELLKGLAQSENSAIYPITVEAYGSPIFLQLNEPIIKLIRDNPFFERRRKIVVGGLEINEAKIYEELAKLDSLKYTMARVLEEGQKNIKTGNTNIIIGESSVLSPLPVFDKYIDLMNKAIRLRYEIRLNEYSAEIISGFTNSKINMRFSLVTSAILGVAYGFLIGFMLVVCRLISRRASG